MVEDYVQPLSIIFVWHPADETTVKPIIDNCTLLLSRDYNKPFSRAMNLPIFYRTSCNKEVPSIIDTISAKTLIFVFISEEIVCDDNWTTYVENLPVSENVRAIPIALDSSAFGIRGVLDGKNFIRSYEYEDAYKVEYLFISITHEIYRCALNESFEEMEIGKNTSLKIFLSHTKDGGNGIKLAKALKVFIDNSSMRNFFDATDISPGYKFNDEIIKNIKESSIIAIHSDNYSTRYWCQREILCAKEYNRPIIAVDTIKEFEDRRFPFASNIPGVYIHLKGEPSQKDLLRILSSTLLETVRFFYSKLLINKYREAGWIDKDVEIRSRPPEVSDIEKLLAIDDNSINLKCKSIVYPEPPVYSEETTFLSKIGIKLYTPLTLDLCSLSGKKIGISISNPEDEDLIRIGQSCSHLLRLSQDIARYVLARGATLIYGGDLRENGFTEFIFNEAQVLQTRLQSQQIYLTNYIAWPNYINDTHTTKKWKAKYKFVAKMVEVPPPEDSKDLVPSEDIYMPPTTIANKFVWSRCLTEMRKKMIENCNIRICAGGKHFGYNGIMPGILEEIIFSIEMKKPLFLVGGFGGITSSICKFIQYGKMPKELTECYQISRNGGYSDLLYLYLNRSQKNYPKYSNIEKITICNLNNGLSDEDNYKLFNTPFIEEVVYLILKGLKNIS